MLFCKNFNHFRHVFAYKLFIEPADKNYFLARFCRMCGMQEEFWWNSAQAIEKYLKAGILLNELSGKKIGGHNITELWSRYKFAYSDYAPSELNKPLSLRNELWGSGDIDAFMCRLNDMGSADSRYGLTSNINLARDLFELDQMVFELRRRTFDINVVVGEDWVDEYLLDFYGKTYGCIMKLHPKKATRKLSIPSEDADLLKMSATDIFFAWNFAFQRTDEDFKRKALPVIATEHLGGNNSYIYLIQSLIIDRDNFDEQEVLGIKWILDRIKLDVGTEKFFRKFV